MSNPPCQPTNHKPVIDDECVSRICHTLHQWLNSIPKLKHPFEEGPIPRNGIYVLFEDGESGHDTNRIVRIGTHTGIDQLRPRLIQHFVNEIKDRSIFRKNIGRCVLNRDNDSFLEHWDLDLTTRRARTAYAGRIDFNKQTHVESQVSEYIRDHFRFVVFEIAEKGRRIELESKIISTVSHCNVCGPSNTWLGGYSPKSKIREYGLWQEKELCKTPLSKDELLELKKSVTLGLSAPASSTNQHN